MALSTAFGFTNTTATTSKSVSLYDMGETTNYGLTEDEPDHAEISNKTCPLDQPEIINYFCRPHGVDASIQAKNVHPNKVKAGVSYGVRYEAMLRTTDSVDATFVVDDPIKVQISINHALNGQITASLVKTALQRAISTLIEADGTWRLDDLMRSSCKPTVS